MTEPIALSIDALCAAGVAELQTGPFGSQLHAHDYVPAGVPVVPTEAISNRRIQRSDLPQISPEKAVELARHKIHAGDILFARRGVQATGQSAFAGTEDSGLICGTGAIRLRIKEGNGKILPNYLSHVLMAQTSRDWLRHQAIGATMPNLNEGIIRRFTFLAPSIEEQKAIADFLDALDDKIELNRRMNESLEAMAQAIFRDWFVDFGPTRRKLAGVTDPIEIMGGLVQEPARAAELAALFPDALGDSGLPEGWESRSLLECANVLSGGTPSKSNEAYWSGDIPWISPKAMTDIHVDDSDDHISTEAVNDGAKLIPVGTTLVMVRGMGLHDGMRVSQARREVTFNQDVKAFVAKDDIPSDFLFWGILALAPELHKRVESSGHGTGKLPSDRILSATLAVPSKDILFDLSRTLTLINERIDLSRRESQTLADTRDLLLPILMSGEIRLRDAEALAEVVQ